MATSIVKTDLRDISGVGSGIEKDLIELGINSINELKGMNPETLYKKLMQQKGQHITAILNEKRILPNETYKLQYF